MPTYPTPHTHTHCRKQRNGIQHTRMQGKRSKVKNFPAEVRKQSKNHCSPVKLESKKIDKKTIDPGRDRGGKLPAIVEEKPRPILKIPHQRNVNKAKIIAHQ